MIKRGKLIVLAYAFNPCYTTAVKFRELEKNIERLTDVNPEELKLDLEERKWSYLNWKNIPIGEGRNDLGPHNQERYGIIGVYDHLNFDHVKRLVLDAQKAVERPSNG